jgi:hypothetical protein
MLMKSYVNSVGGATVANVRTRVWLVNRLAKPPETRRSLQKDLLVAVQH